MLLPVVAGATFVAAIAIGCSTAEGDAATTDLDAGTPLWRDSAPVDPAESGGEPVDDGGALVAPSCEKYCTLVMAHCTGDNAQYASRDECVAFCPHLPPSQAPRQGPEKQSPTLACRQYFADSPAQTDPKSYCLAAGPYGGNVCGDRCTAFCGVLLSACTPDGGVAPYATQADCASDCAAFSYRDAGSDGGGEHPSGPKTGDTLNCRLHYLRAATQDPAGCRELHPDGGACRW